ncbi:MAG: FkbM family methyltransferase, partial [Elusimicrobia bacterium]|nr:FkbM family methyltransferase [Elusimicrobiota bacterium]
NYAVYNQKGEISFYIDPKEKDSAVCGTTPQVLLGLGCEVEEIKVDSVLLSNYITGPIDILKLDVEASEGIILKEICEKLDLVKALILDFNYSPNFLNNKNDISEILAILGKKGFKYSMSSSLRKELLWDSKGKPFDLLIYAYKSALKN